MNWVWISTFKSSDFVNESTGRTFFIARRQSVTNSMAITSFPAACSFRTGKSLSEALIFASTNPQYDNRLLIVHESCKLRILTEHVVYTNCCFCFVLTFRTILVHNMFCRCCELLKKIYLYISDYSNLPRWLRRNFLINFVDKAQKLSKTRRRVYVL